MKMRDRAPAYRDLLLHFGAVRLVALREGDMNEGALGTENESEVLKRAPAHVEPARSAFS